jgi:hypothetical protein
MVKRRKLVETEKNNRQKHAGGMEQGESGKKRQVNLPKTRFTVEDKRCPLTKTVIF